MDRLSETKDKKAAKKEMRNRTNKERVREREIYWLSSKRYTMTTIHYKQLIMAYITKKKNEEDTYNTRQNYIRIKDKPLIILQMSRYIDNVFFLYKNC
jgi:hypothetical protein